jgi:SAM-dependent methyltransferase
MRAREMLKFQEESTRNDGYFATVPRPGPAHSHHERDARSPGPPEEAAFTSSVRGQSEGFGWRRSQPGVSPAATMVLMKIGPTTSMTDAEDLLRTWRATFSEPFTGWEFANMGVRDDPLPWSYSDLAAAALGRSRSVLDIGTGGREQLASLGPVWPDLVVATESWPPNVPVAARRLSPLGVFVVQDGGSGGEPLPFCDGAFDLVLARHEAVVVGEIARALRPGGFFVTQQVVADNLDELRACFGIVRHKSLHNVDLSGNALEAAGLRVVEARDWHGRTWFDDVTALVSYLRAVPWELPGFDPDVHAGALFKLHAEGPGSDHLWDIS